MYEAKVRSKQLSVVYGVKDGTPVLITPITSAKPTADVFLVDLTKEIQTKINKGLLELVEKRKKREDQSKIKSFSEHSEDVKVEVNEKEEEIVEETVKVDPFNVMEVKVKGSSSNKLVAIEVTKKKKPKKSKKK